MTELLKPEEKDDLACEIGKLVAAHVAAAVKAERERIHTEINKMLEPIKMHLGWLVEDGNPDTMDYGLCDEEGDWVDIGIIEDALEAMEDKQDE